MGPTWGPPGSCRPQMGPMLAPWTLLSGVSYAAKLTVSVLLTWDTSFSTVIVISWSPCGGGNWNADVVNGFVVIASATKITFPLASLTVTVASVGRAVPGGIVTVTSKPAVKLLEKFCCLTTRFFDNVQKGHSIAHPWGRGMWCLSWVECLVYSTFVKCCHVICQLIKCVIWRLEVTLDSQRNINVKITLKRLWGVVWRYNDVIITSWVHCDCLILHV